MVELPEDIQKAGEKAMRDYNECSRMFRVEALCYSANLDDHGETYFIHFRIVPPYFLQCSSQKVSLARYVKRPM